MPLDIHVYDGPKTPDSAPWVGQERYATDPNSATVAGKGRHTNADDDKLGEYTARGLMRYRDLEAFVCECHYTVFGVVCPRCEIRSDGFDLMGTCRIGHVRTSYTSQSQKPFRITTDYDMFEGLVWVRIACRKCDFEFRVIKR